MLRTFQTPLVLTYLLTYFTNSSSSESSNFQPCFPSISGSYHERLSDILKKNVCRYCSKVFPAPLSLARHETTHTSDRPFVCNNCGRTFKTKGVLKTHMITHMNKKD